VESSIVVAEPVGVLNLRPGELVEVRSKEEILRTLDSNGTLESLPFMPEMLEFCGRQFRVYKRADKVCDTIEWQKHLRRMENAVHLEDLRCNGAAHGGCQAGCLIHWKEAWLKRVAEPLQAQPSVVVDSVDAGAGHGNRREDPVCTTDTLLKATRVDNEESDDEIFSCQATELLRATTSPIPWWEPTQYVRDVRTGNAGARQVIRGLLVGFFNKFQQANARLFPRFCLIRGCRNYPFVEGKATGEAPRSVLDLQPGEIVEVKSKEEIFETLDARDRNHGLRYDSEMLKYCGQQGRVLRRVQQIIDEQTGKMRYIKTDCIILEGVICSGDYHRSCPRSIYPYWREIWLKRIEQPSRG
jgi:predicted DNA-binding antitoxin AbrB/MazE fold protein